MKHKLVWGFVLCACLALLMMGAAWAEAPVDLPVAGNWLDATVTIPQEYAQFRLVISGAPQLVTLEMKAGKDDFSCLLVEIWDGPDELEANSTEYLPYQKNKSKGAFKQTVCLNPGTYYAVVCRDAYNDFGPFVIPFQIRATLAQLNGHAFDPEPNDSPLEAVPVAPGQALGGLIANGDEDYYVLAMDEGAKLKLTLKQYRARTELALWRLKDGMTEVDVRRYLNDDGKYDEELPPDPFDSLAWLSGSKSVKAPSSKSLSISLSKGTYYLCLSTDTGNQDFVVSDDYGFYDLTIQAAGEPATTLVLPKSYKLPVGIGAALRPAMKPGYFSLIPVGYTSSNPTVATVDPATGVVTPLKPGKTTITAKTPDGKKKAATALSVVTADANRFSRKKPLRGKLWGIYASTKSLRYEGEALVGEVFVYNNMTEKVNLSHLDGMRELRALLIDMDANNDYAMDQVEIGYITDYTVLKSQPIQPGIPNQVIKPGKYGVLTVRIDGVPRLNLTNGRYNVTLDDESSYAIEGRIRFGKGTRMNGRLTGLLPTMKEALP